MIGKCFCQYYILKIVRTWGLKTQQPLLNNWNKTLGKQHCWIVCRSQRFYKKIYITIPINLERDHDSQERAKTLWWFWHAWFLKNHDIQEMHKHRQSMTMQYMKLMSSRIRNLKYNQISAHSKWSDLLLINLRYLSLWRPAPTAPDVTNIIS